MALQPGVLTSKSLTASGLTTRGSYNQGSLQPGVLTTRVSYNQGSYNQGFLQPGVVPSSGLTTRVLTSRGSYEQVFLQAGVLTTRGSYNENERMSIKNSLRCVLRFSLVVHGSIYGRLRVLRQTVFSLHIRFTKANPRAQTSKYVYDNSCEREAFCFTCRTKDFSSGSYNQGFLQPGVLPRK